MKEEKKKTRLIIGILIFVIIVLLSIIAYVFIVKPAINGLIVKGYNQGAQNVIIQIAQQATTCQQVPLVIGNQTINIVAVGCL
jgi:hypothetical protein